MQCCPNLCLEATHVRPSKLLPSAPQRINEEFRFPLGLLEQQRQQQQPTTLKHDQLQRHSIQSKLLSVSNQAPLSLKKELKEEFLDYKLLF